MEATEWCKAMFDENSGVSGVSLCFASFGQPQGKSPGNKAALRCEAVLACGLDSGSSCLVRALTGVTMLCS